MDTTAGDWRASAAGLFSKRLFPSVVDTGTEIRACEQEGVGRVERAGSAWEDATTSEWDESAISRVVVLSKVA